MSYLRLLSFIVCAVVFTAGAAGGQAVYFRVAAGYHTTADTEVRDLDCTATSPPALFGCVDDAEGRPLAARGDFGAGGHLELAAGVELGARSRLELAIAALPDLDLDAEADFLGVSGEQPVSSEGRAVTAMLVGAVDVAPERWSWRPFLTAGVGAARTETDRVTYAFPGIAEVARTVTLGGRHLDLAWTAGAGVSRALGERTVLDLAVRYADLGELRTSAGPATIVRPSRTFQIDIAGTRAEVELWALDVGLRWRF